MINFATFCPQWYPFCKGNINVLEHKHAASDKSSSSNKTEISMSLWCPSRVNEILSKTRCCQCNCCNTLTKCSRSLGRYKFRYNGINTAPQSLNRTPCNQLINSFNTTGRSANKLDRNQVPHRVGTTCTLGLFELSPPGGKTLRVRITRTGMPSIMDLKVPLYCEQSLYR